MRQIICSFRTGETRLEEVPAPIAEPGHLVIRTTRSLVSQGTEKMLVQFGKASLWQKARSQPAKVKQVLGKIRTEGLFPTVEAVFRKLDEPLPLGYCNAGTVLAVGDGVVGFAVGDRVASNGPHAEIVAVPANLAAKVPDAVSDEAAAFTVIGAIGLQGIRLMKPELGETAVVIGLGLIGQLAGQLLRAHGCRVIGFDFDREKVELARSLGMDARMAGGGADPVADVFAATQGLGADGVLIAASTPSNDVMRQSAQMSRKRGRIILVGVVGLELNRADFYEKELTFQVSCSYGPGRYDDNYEEKGFDYPAAFVRWTENRNFQAVLGAMAAGSLRVEPLLTRKVPLERYAEIYDHLDGGGLASIFTYPEPPAAVSGQIAESPRAGTSTERLIRVSGHSVAIPALAVVGAGNFTKMTAMPALAEADAPVKAIVSSGGVSGTALAKKYGVPYSGTDLASVLDDPDIGGVILTTRHNLHAAQAIAALRAGKRVLVEKPLCLTEDELQAITAEVAAAGAGTWLTVGFNRRFSPHVIKMRSLLGERPDPLSVVATMNAGAIPASHWVHDPAVGGGRLVGEACHYIDLAVFLTGSPVAEIAVSLVGGATDCASILLRHRNGSTSVVNYLSNGHREISKERVEVCSRGRTLQLDNFRELRGYGFGGFGKLRTRQDKGHRAQFGLFAQRVREKGPALVPWSEVQNVARATLAIPRAVADRRWVNVD